MMALFEGEGQAAQRGIDSGIEPAYEDLLPRIPRPVQPLQFPGLQSKSRDDETSGSELVRLEQERLQNMRVMLDEARAAAREEALAEMEAQMDARLHAERERLHELCAQMVVDRREFFHAAEAAVVELTLAIARRVLHREVDLGMLPLRSVVKAALDRVREGSRCVLRVQADSVPEWEQMIGSAGRTIEVVGDVMLTAAECELGTEVGKVDVSVNVQMSEIERSFFQLTDGLAR